MDEEDIETAKSEFRLGMICILHTEFIYTQMRKGKCHLGVSWPATAATITESRHYYSVCFLMPMTLHMYT